MDCICTCVHCELCKVEFWDCPLAIVQTLVLVYTYMYMPTHSLSGCTSVDLVPLYTSYVPVRGPCMCSLVVTTVWVQYVCAMCAEPALWSSLVLCNSVVLQVDAGCIAACYPLVEAVMLEWSQMCWIVKVKTPSWCYDISVYYYLFSLSSGLVFPHYHSHSPVLWFCDVVMTRYLQKLNYLLLTYVLV